MPTCYTITTHLALVSLSIVCCLLLTRLYPPLSPSSVMTSSAFAAAPATIGVLLGSLRQNGNNAGLASWLTTVARRVLSTNTSATAYTIQQIFPFPTATPATSASPLRYPGPVIDGHMPQAVRSTADYPASIQRWSAAVRSCVAFVIITPQYNWGVPGELKNAVDHLYHEWTDKPILVVTYGGHGGHRCDEQLRLVMGGGLKMRVVQQKVQLTLPREFIAGERRVGDGQDDGFLEQYEAALSRAVNELVDLLQPAAAAAAAAGTAGIDAAVNA